MKDINMSTENFFLWVGAVGFLTLALTVVVIVCILRTKKMVKESSAPEVLSSPTPCSETNHAVQMVGETSELEIEAAKYHTIDEIAVAASIAAVGYQEERYDGQGYVLIQNKITNTFSQDDTTNKPRRFRPLREPPISNDKDLHVSSSETTTSTGKSSCPTSMSLPATDVAATSFPSSADRKARICSMTMFPTSHVQSTRYPELSTIFPRPRPHKRQVDLDDHTYLDVVKLRPDSAITEVKLVRTQYGKIQLVSDKEDIPAFRDYHTRILLINRKEKVLGVGGVVDKLPAIYDTRTVPNSLRERRRSFPCGSNASDYNVVTSNIRNACRVDEPNKSIASVNKQEDLNFSSCEYLTVLDIQPEGEISAGTAEYLTVMDMESGEQRR